MTPPAWHLRDGRSLRWWSGGDPDGVPIVFFHGCPDTRHAAFPGAAPAAREGIRLVAFNRPGYAGSDATASDHLTVADDVAELADGLGIDTFAVLGMSVGGGYALACAARHSDRVTAAAAVAAPADVTRLEPRVPRDGLDPADVALFDRIAAASSIEEAAELLRPGYEDFVASRLGDDPDDETLVARFFGGLTQPDAAAVAPIGVPALAANAREALAEPEGYLRDAAVTFRAWRFEVEDVRCPTALWYGGLDPQTAVRNGRWLADRIAGAALHLDPDSAHLSTLLGQWGSILRELRLLANRP